MEISVISPVYQAEQIVKELCKRLLSILPAITNEYEIILVEDGSSDKSWNEIESICIKHKEVKGIKLSRNFGQHNAISAGLRLASGNWIVVMDCDLQDDPSEILNLYNKTKEGFDIVLAQRAVRQDSKMKKITSKWFYKFYSYFTDTQQDETLANFGIYKNDVIKSVNQIGDHERVFPTLVQWVGFKKAKISVGHNQRFAGKSTYNFSKLFSLAFRMIISFSDKPLRIALLIGSFVSFASFCFGIFYFIEAISGRITEPGYASIIISIWFLGGTILFFIGVLGLYIGKIFEKVKNRPNYIIEQTQN
ncbi:MAG TPA: glycosyltransferase family 2 protein [Panacibacter sp.]|nr:glycosyltransferase family 2 protein [Panacibacter sp.]